MGVDTVDLGATVELTKFTHLGANHGSDYEDYVANGIGDEFAVGETFSDNLIELTVNSDGSWNYFDKRNTYNAPSGIRYFFAHYTITYPDGETGQFYRGFQFSQQEVYDWVAVSDFQSIASDGPVSGQLLQMTRPTESLSGRVWGTIRRLVATTPTCLLGLFSMVFTAR